MLYKDKRNSFFIIPRYTWSGTKTIADRRECVRSTKSLPDIRIGIDLDRVINLLPDFDPEKNFDSGKIVIAEF